LQKKREEIGIRGELHHHKKIKKAVLGAQKGFDNWGGERRSPRKGFVLRSTNLVRKTGWKSREKG